ncbi:MAG: hypothetical protein IKJ65_00655 [Clostridia bacterium]|nr:hypothetical protein [Clostridia bacterium]
MKRILCGLLSLILLFSASAVSEAVGGPIIEPEAEITIDRVYKTLSLNGEESPTHGWIVVDVTITNYSLHTISVEDDISADLMYDGMYAFSAEPAFAISEFEPLVRLSGSVVFKVPKLVLEAESYKIAAALNVDGKIIPISMDSDEKASSVSVTNDFDTPEELLVTFIDCLKNADFENLIRLFAYKEKGKYLDFDLYLRRFKIVLQQGGNFYPDYEEYAPVKALSRIQPYQINTMLLSLFSERGGNGSGRIVRYKDGVVSGDDYFTGEEMTLGEYVDRLNPERLGSLTLESISRIPVDPEESIRASFLANGLMNGYSDIRDYILRVSFEGETYYLGAALCRYPEGWKIDSLGSQITYSIVNGDLGEFVKEEYVDDSGLDQLIYTWKNGEIISENLLKEPEITAEDLIGAWTYNGETAVFEDKRVKDMTNADGSEKTFLYCVSENYLYLFSEEGKSEGKVRIALDGDWLTLMGEEGEKITVCREK